MAKKVRKLVAGHRTWPVPARSHVENGSAVCSTSIAGKRLDGVRSSFGTRRGIDVQAMVTVTSALPLRKRRRCIAKSMHRAMT
jgi:hypothetical protein